MEITSFTYVRPENVALVTISIFLMVEAAFLKDLNLDVKTQDPRVLQLVSNFPCWPVTAYVTMYTSDEHRTSFHCNSENAECSRNARSALERGEHSLV